jgi:O-antigen ligase
MKQYFQRLHLANKYLLVLLGFCIPVSTALTNVMLGLLVLGAAAGQWRGSVHAMGLVVFLMHMIGLAYTDGDTEKVIESLTDGTKLLFIGMMIYFADKKFHPAFLASS